MDVWFIRFIPSVSAMSGEYCLSGARAHPSPVLPKKLHRASADAAATRGPRAHAAVQAEGGGTGMTGTGWRLNE